MNSQDYRRCWIERGIPAEKLEILPRGLDTKLFHPSRRDEQFWRARGLRDGEVGMLFRWTHLQGEEPRYSRGFDAPACWSGKRPVRPLFIGDGPYLPEMKRLLPDALFTGYLRGEELASAYASR